MRRPTMTDTVYIPSWPPTSARFFISTIFPAIRKRIPTGAYLREETNVGEDENGAKLRDNYEFSYTAFFYRFFWTIFFRNLK